MNLSDAASFAVAAATLVLAGFTWSAVNAAKEAVDAANKTAQAAGREADATLRLADEASRDRELAWAPVLTIEITGSSSFGDGDWAEDAIVSNVGTGPALQCYYYAYEDNRWGITGGFALRTGERRDVSVRGETQREGFNYPMGVFNASPGVTPPPAPNRLRVLFCSDVLGNRWRFLEGCPPDRVRSDDPAPPPWAKAFS